MSFVTASSFATSAHAASASAAAHDTSRRMSFSQQGGCNAQYDASEGELLDEYSGDTDMCDDSQSSANTQADEWENSTATNAKSTYMLSGAPPGGKAFSSLDMGVSSSSSSSSAGMMSSSMSVSSSLSCSSPSKMSSQPVTFLGVDSSLEQEVITSMYASENKYRIYNENAKYLRHRRIIVDWISEVGEEYKLSQLTIHLSVRYLDRILSSIDVVKNRLQLVAMSCILIATKYEEAEDMIPTLQELNECSNNAYTVDALKEMEVSVLRHLGWSLTCITPIHFLQFYQARGIIFETDEFESAAGAGPEAQEENKKAVVKYVKKYADFFGELCLQEYSFQQYPPSIMASAIVAASRRAVKIDPIWNSSLEKLTSYNEQSIFRAYKHLYQYYIESFPAAPQQFPSPRSVIVFEERGSMGA